MPFSIIVPIGYNAVLENLSKSLPPSAPLVICSATDDDIPNAIIDGYHFVDLPLLLAEIVLTIDVVDERNTLLEKCDLRNVDLITYDLQNIIIRR